MIDEDANLLPCPFCGGEACVGVGRLITSDFGSDAYAYVTCGECGASTDEVYGDKADESEIVKQAVAAWNRRAERTCRIDMPVIDWETGETDYVCSACGFSADPQDWAETYDYCPRCGAKVVTSDADR